MTNIMDACVGKILGFLAEPVIRHVWAYVIQYKNEVQQLEQQNKRLCEKKERIQGMVDTAKNNGKTVETEVSSWLKKAKGMEQDIANFLGQQENRESEGMERDIANLQGQQENRESFNLMWRHKRGMEADKLKSKVIELVSTGDRLEKFPVARDAPFQWEPQFDSSQYYTMFGSRALVFASVIEALKDSRVKLIGVHGPGGAGKTTMVKEVAKEAKNLGIFDKIVIVVVSKDPNTSKVQKELAPQLDLKFVEESDSGRADELRKTLLNGKKILVILDDLWQGLDLNTIGIPISGPSHNNCIIFLTSRREEVFKVMRVHRSFSIGHLEKNEAWELFTKVTGDFGVDELIARQVCERCGGLPIAIVAVGAALKDEEESEWHNALHKLKNSPLKYIEGIDPMGYTPLKWSYEFLKEEDARSCFLLCCLFPEDAQIKIDDLVRYSFALGFLRKVDTLKVARNVVQAMVKKLKKSCLLLNGVHENYVKMHDVIRDLAISITEEKQTKQGGGCDWPGQQQFIVDHDIQKWPENDAWKHHTAISLRINDDNIHFPCGVLHCPLMHTLVLKSRKYSLKIPNDFFQGMKGARVLDLKGIWLDLPSLVLELDHLRMLCLNNCELLGVPAITRNLKNYLEILSFKGSTIKELPQEIGKLTRLRCLDLRGCLSLKVIPKGVIANLIHLEELYVTTRFKEWDTIVYDGGMSNASIAELKLLTRLTILHVKILEKSSRIMVQECPELFKKLINFIIFIGVGPNSSNQDLESLNVLEINGIPHIDDVFRHLMDKVGALRLYNIQDLRYLPQLHDTPSGGRSFSKLVSLSIIGCDSIKYLFLPSCARALQQLKTLVVCDCSKMEHIIGVGDYYQEEEVVTDEASGGRSFSKLVSLFIIRCHSIKYLFLPSCARALQQLKILKVRDCSKMEHIIGVGDYYHEEEVVTDEASGGRSFSKLVTLDIIRCDSIKYLFLPSCARALQQLQRLEVRDCSKMEHIIGVGDYYHEEEVVTDEAIVFNQLTEIHLKGLLQFKSFYRKMEMTTIEGNPSNWTTTAKSIFNEKVSFPVLKDLMIGELSVENIWNKQMIKSSKGSSKLSFSQLTNVHIWNCDNLINVFPSNMLPRLQNLETFIAQSLTKIHIEKCLKLRSLFTYSVATTLQHLEKLSVISCEIIEEIIIIEENNINFTRGENATCHIKFSLLKELVFFDLPNLKNICNDESASFSFPSLCEVRMWNCPKMKTFASGQICLPPGKIQATVGDQEIEITDLNAIFELRDKDSNHMKMPRNLHLYFF